MSVPLADRRSRPGPGRGGTGSYCWATGLASTAGRIPAAILALTAAALTAAARFLRSSERYEIDWTKAKAWQALYRSSSAASKGEDSHDIRRLYGIIQSVLCMPYGHHGNRP